MSTAAAPEPSQPPPGWPRLPFDWPHHESREGPGAWACRIDTVAGRWLQAFARDVDPRARDWHVAPKAAGPFVTLALARVARITLSAPLHARQSSVDPGPARIPQAAFECDYVLRTAEGRELLHGRTVGHVDTDDGLFLFAAAPGEIALNRIFVPRAAQLRCEFGPTADGRAPVQWITDRVALCAAFASQRNRRIPRIGEALVQLGFVTPPQIAQALAQPGLHGRLGERLVQQGLVTPTQLETGLAFKLGYPLVDLARFPIDTACARMLSPDLARRHGVIAIELEGRQIVVAVDGPATYAALAAAIPWPGHRPGLRAARRDPDGLVRSPGRRCVVAGCAVAVAQAVARCSRQRWPTTPSPKDASASWPSNGTGSAKVGSARIREQASAVLRWRTPPHVHRPSLK